MLSKAFELFVEGAADSVMARGATERLLSPRWVDAVFEKTPDGRDTRELLFSSVLNLAIRVVMSQSPSVHYRYMRDDEEIVDSLISVFDELGGVTPETAAGLVHDSALTCAEAITRMGGRNPDLLPGYTIRVLDGNYLAATDHRKKSLRSLRSLGDSPLPGKTLVVFDPGLGCVVDMLPAETGHTQDSSLLPDVFPMAEAGQVWVADRALCTRRFLFGVANRDSAFVVDEHGDLPFEELGPVMPVGETDSGHVSEQEVRLRPDGDGPEGESLTLRRVVVLPKGSTKGSKRAGARLLHVLTNLPSEVDATAIASLHHERWRIEPKFQKLERDFRSEIGSPVSPEEALFGFAAALVAYNVIALVNAALRAHHGALKIEQELSHYYLANSLERMCGGMVIAIAPERWQVFAEMTREEFAATLLFLSGKVDLERFPKSPSQPRKPRKPSPG